MGNPNAKAFVERVVELMRLMAPGFIAGQKPRVVLALGCTGGRHRSVALAEEIARVLEKDPAFVVGLRHRDIDKTGQL